MKNIKENPKEITLKEVVEELKEIREELRKTRKELGKVTEGISHIPEGFTEESIINALNSLGIVKNIERKGGEVKIINSEKYADMWLTGEIKGEEYIFYVEIKTTATSEKIEEFKDAIRKAQEKAKVIGIFSAIKFPEDYKKYALRQNLWIMYPADNTLKIEIPE